MKILNTAHVAYQVSDLNKALAFYEGCLGLKQKFSILNSELIVSFQSNEAGNISLEYQQYLEHLMTHPNDIWMLYLEVAPHQFIELFSGNPQMPYINADIGQNGFLHLSLEVDDIYKAREELLEKKANVTSEVSMGLDKTWQFWAADPDGNKVEFFQYTKDSWQVTGR